MKVKTIYVNLPVSNVAASRSFWAALGFSFNEQFSNEQAACLILNEGLMYVMLVSHQQYSTFTPRPIADGTTTQVLNALELASKAEVDRMVSTALALGATRYAEAKDHGWMYYDSFADLDGHQWEVMFLDPTQIPEQ